MEKERALAHIEKIEWVKPIDGADNIELIGVLGWTLIAKIGEFHVGDIAVYIEIDSKVPESDERFEFLGKKHYKVKTMKLSKFNVYSQGLALPLSIFPELVNKNIGDDVTSDLKITYSSEEDIKRKSNNINKNAKYDSMKSRHKKLFSKPLVKKIMRYKIGRQVMFLIFGSKNDKPTKFPDWMNKTDEARCENCPWVLASKDKWIVTEKLDGTSCSYGVKRMRHGKNKFDFAVCSRNVRQKSASQDCYHESNIYWELEEKYHIKDVLTSFAIKNKYETVVLQGEGIGKVQGNPYQLKENDLYVFNLIIDGLRVGSLDMAKFCEKNNLKHVPIITENHTLPNTMEELKIEADGYSVVNPKVKREGFVYRTQDGVKSFKNVSREYLLKHNG